MTNERMRDEAFRGLGKFTVVFNEVELGLHDLIAAIVGHGEAPAIAALTREMGFRDLTEALRRLAKTDSVPVALKDDIRELVNKATALNTERNSLMHSMMALSTDRPPELLRVREMVEINFGPAVSGRQMTEREVQGFIAQALEVANDVFRLVDSIDSPGSDI